MKNKMKEGMVKYGEEVAEGVEDGLSESRTAYADISPEEEIKIHNLDGVVDEWLKADDKTLREYIDILRFNIGLNHSLLRLQRLGLVAIKDCTPEEVEEITKKMEDRVHNTCVLLNLLERRMKERRKEGGK